MSRGRKGIIAALVVIILLLVGILFRPGVPVPQIGSPEYFDRIMGLKSRPTEIVRLRRDGSMLEVTACYAYRFPETDDGFFANPPRRFFERPIAGSWEQDKVFVRWRKTPVAPEHRHFLKLIALASSIGLQDIQASSITDVASSSNGYYAVSYADDGSGRNHNVTLFLIEPRARRFYYLDDTNTGFEAEPTVGGDGKPAPQP